MGTTMHHIVNEMVRIQTTSVVYTTSPAVTTKTITTTGQDQTTMGSKVTTMKQDGPGSINLRSHLTRLYPENSYIISLAILYYMLLL